MHPQVDERPVTPKANHLVKVTGSHCHLPVNNMGGVGGVPPPLSQALHQNGTSKVLGLVP